MQKMRSILLVTLVAIINLTLMASTQNIDLPRSTPAREGVEPQAIATFVDSLMAVPLYACSPFSATQPTMASI